MPSIVACFLWLVISFVHYTWSIRQLGKENELKFLCGDADFKIQLA